MLRKLALQAPLERSDIRVTLFAVPSLALKEPASHKLANGLGTAIHADHEAQFALQQSLPDNARFLSRMAL